MLLSELKRNDVIAFDVYPDGMIESDFNPVTYLGTVSKDLVVAHGYDADAVYARCYSYLPDNNYSLDAGEYDWIVVRNENNNKLSYLCSLWIKEGTLEVINNDVLVIRVYNHKGTESVKAISNALNTLELTDFEIISE